MKLIPFVLTKQRTESFEFTRCTLFLSHAGKSLWQTDETGILSPQALHQEYLDPNGFAVKSVQIDPKKNIAYIEVDASQMTFQDFYTWEEALAKQDKPECWRHFYFVHDKEGVEWWSPQGISEADFQSGESISEVFREITLRFSDT